MGLAFHDLNIEDSTFYGSYLIFDVFFFFFFFCSYIFIFDLHVFFVNCSGNI